MLSDVTEFREPSLSLYDLYYEIDYHPSSVDYCKLCCSIDETKHQFQTAVTSVLLWLRQATVGLHVTCLLINAVRSSVLDRIVSQYKTAPKP